MVLAIKIKDDINIPQTAQADFSFGFDYFNAQNQIRSIFSISNDLKFDIFQKSIFENFTFNPWQTIKAYNLYYLANSQYISNKLQLIKSYNLNLISSDPSVTDEKLIPLENQLNYFGFNIKKYPTKAQFKILNDLKKNNIIESYWIEGDTSVASEINPISINPIVATNLNTSTIAQNLEINDFEKDFNYELIQNRGAKADIICFEEDATDDIATINQSNIYLNNFPSNAASFSFLGAIGQNGNYQHQINTLQILFAKPPLNQTFFHLNGICPEANIKFLSVKPMAINNYMGKIRRNLTEISLNPLKNSILFFEFETDIPLKINRKVSSAGRFPITIYPEINTRLTELTKLNNFIILEGSGNMNIDFDKIEKAPWNITKGTKYNNLSENNPSIIMVGGVEKGNDNVFKKNGDTNICKSIDVLMYTNLLVKDKENNPIRYSGSSGAVAVTAGIIAYLQGRAIQEMSDPETGGLATGFNRTKGVFSIDIIKKLFRKTFKKDFAEGILLTPFTLEELWQESQKIINTV